MTRLPLLLPLLAATAWAETRAQYGGAAQAALASAPTTLDPMRGGPGDAEIAALIYDAPFTLADGKPRPSLALALDNPEGSRRARLTVRSDVRFSDGTALTARDLLASLKRAAARGWTLAPIVALTPAGEQAIDLELARPTAELALLLSTVMVTPGGAAPGKRAVGSGPFVVEAVDAQSVRLSANPGYFGGRPYLSALTLRVFASRNEEAGSYEVGALQAARHALGTGDAPGSRRPAVTVEGPQSITGFIAVGRIAEAELVRRVVALAINRERLRRLTVREPATAIKASYDPGRAKSEVERRWPGARPKLSLLVDGSRFDDADAAGRILADLARVGLDVSIEARDAADYQARVESGRYELYLGAAAPPAPSLEAVALLAAVDVESARAALASGGAVDLEKSRVVPLYRRAARLVVAPALGGLAVDGAGRAGWADAHWLAP